MSAQEPGAESHPHEARSDLPFIEAISWQGTATCMPAMTSGSRCYDMDAGGAGAASWPHPAEPSSTTSAGSPKWYSSWMAASCAVVHDDGCTHRPAPNRVVSLIGLMRQVAESNLAEVERMVSQLFSESDPDGALEPTSRDALRAVQLAADAWLSVVAGHRL